MSDKVPMTLEGAEALKKELKMLKTEGRRRVSKALEEARAHGDLSENAEYDAAKNEQGLMEARIRNIGGQLGNAQIIDPSKLKSDKVVFGAKVTVVDEETDEEKMYYLVGVEEADLDQDKISITSPVARALIGKKVGDQAEVRAPGGERYYEILSINF